MMRERFNIDDILTLRHYEGSEYIERKFIVNRILGEGASCITYLVTYKENNTYIHSGVLKEFNPVSEKINIDKFLDGYKLQSSFRNEIKNAKNITSNTEGIYEGYGKKYILMTCDEGISYENIDEENIEDIIRTAIAITNAVKIYHNSGYLHLDIKPDNIFIMPETREIVKLFDFDSVHKKEELSTSILSYSKQWAAFELLQAEDNYKICEATDLYSIGAVVFYKIMGRIPNDEEKGRFSKYQFDKENVIFQNVNPKIFKMLTILFRKTLNDVVGRRYKSAEELKEYLEEILKISDKRTPYPINMRWSASENALGRENEIIEIHERLNKDNTVFIRSMGGVGKSEVAKMYAKEYKDRYNTIQFVTFEKSLKYTISNNLVLANFNEEDYKENEDVLFKEKLKVFESLDEDTLIVIDNFNVSFDEDIDKIITNKNLGHKVIFTTRNFNEDYENLYLELNTLSEETCIKLYYDFFGKMKKHREDNLDTIKEILKVVLYNTLLIKLIALNCRKQRMKPEIMLEKLKNCELATVKGKISHKLNDSSEERNALLYEHLCAIFNVAGLKKNEKFIMMTLSLVGRSKIDVSKFCEWCGIDDFDDINSLVECGWIELDIENDMLSLHHIISDISYEELKPDGNKCSQFIKSFITILQSENYKSYFQKKQYINFSRLIARKIIPEGEMCAELFYELGKILSLRENDKAECTEYLKNAEKIYCEIYGKINEKIADINYTFGIMYRTFIFSFNIFNEENKESDEEIWNKFIVFFEKYVLLTEEVFKDNLEKVAEAYLKIGKAYSEMFLNVCCIEENKDDEIAEKAEYYYVKFFEIEKSVYEKDKEKDELKKAAQIVSDFYSDLSNPRFNEAQSCYYRKKYIENINQCDTEDEELKDIEYYFTLARSEKDNKNYDKALEYYKKCLQCEEDDVFYSYYKAYAEIIEMYRDIGEYDKALKYHFEMKKICRLNIDDEAESYYELGDIYLKTEQYELAYENFYKAISLWEKYMVNQKYASKEYAYKQILFCNLKIGQYYINQYEYDNAEKSFHKCLEIYSEIKVLDKDMVDDIYGLYENVGNLYALKKDYNRAYENYIKEINKLKENSWKNKEIINICMRFLDILKNEEEINCEYMDVIDKYNGKLTDSTYKIIDIYIKIGEAYCDEDVYKKSLSYFNKALEYSERLYGREHYFTAKLYGLIGDIYEYRMDDMNGLGKEYMNKCNYRLIAEKESSECFNKPKKQFEFFEDAGRKYESIEKYNDSIVCFKEALNIIKNNINNDLEDGSYYDTITYYDYISMNDLVSYNYTYIKDYDSAVKYAKDNLKVMKKCLKSKGYYNPTLYNIAEKCIDIADFYFVGEKLDEALEYYLEALKYESSNIDFIIRVYNKIIDVYKIKQDMDEVKVYREKLWHLNNSELEVL